MRFIASKCYWEAWTILLLSVAALPGCSLAVDKKINGEGKTSFVTSEASSVFIRCHDKMIRRLHIACLHIPGGSSSPLFTSHGVGFVLRFLLSSLERNYVSNEHCTRKTYTALSHNDLFMRHHEQQT